MRGIRFRPGPRRRGGHLVAFVTGGEPVEGCTPVAAVIVGDSVSDIEQRAERLGIWRPRVWPNFRPSRAEADMALSDSHRFIWRAGHETSWRPSEGWEGQLSSA